MVPDDDDEDVPANKRQMSRGKRTAPVERDAVAGASKGNKKVPQKKPRVTPKESRRGATADMTYPGSTAMFAGIARRSPREHKPPVTGFLPKDAEDFDPFAIVGTVPFPGRQPFAVEVYDEAVLLADLHAHMMQTEVIGYLGGTYDAEKDTLRILSAFPGQPLISGDHEVELDPTSEVALRERAMNAKMEIVGWYHSHPTFVAEPSVRDVQNHSNYQTLLHSRGPFVGCIVSPYGAGKGHCASSIRWFVTEEAPGGTACRLLEVSITPLGHFPADFSTALKEQIQELIETVSENPRRWSWTTDWDDTTMKSAAQYRTITSLCKAMTSTYGHTVAAMRTPLANMSIQAPHFNDLQYEPYNFFTESPPDAPLPDTYSLVGEAKAHQALSSLWSRQRALKRLENVLLLAWGIP